MTLYSNEVHAVNQGGGNGVYMSKMAAIQKSQRAIVEK